MRRDPPGIDLAEEFGTTAVIVGGREAGKVVDRLKAKDVPVILRLDFPDDESRPTSTQFLAGSAVVRDARRTAKSGDWSIFRPADPALPQDVGRKHGPVPFASGLCSSPGERCERLVHFLGGKIPAAS